MAGPRSSNRHNPGPVEETAERRRPYSKPRIISREVLEVMAGVCPEPLGKATGTCMIPTS